MNSAVLKLYGDIGEPSGIDLLMDGADIVSASMVRDFLDQNPDANFLTVRINSRGGDVQEGWAIYDLLVNSGKKITTVGEGKVYSIATIVFLAGEKRQIMQNADGLIHNPFIPEYTLADKYESDDLEKIAEALRQEEEKILDLYVERTGSPRDKLASYMAEDTKLSSQDMLDLGFATEIVEPVKAYAYIKPQNNLQMPFTETDKKTWGEKLDAILDRVKNISRVSTLDQTLKDKEGNEFKLEKETGAPAVGDKASPDGTYPMEDGKTITIADGAITEIKEPQQNKSDLEIANAKIAEMQQTIDNQKAQIDALNAEKPDIAAKEAELEEATVKAQGLATELQNLKNQWQPDGRTKFSSAEKVGNINLNEVRELRDKMKGKTKNE